MVRRGVEVHIACLRGGVNFERAKKSGAVVHELGFASNYDPRILWWLRRIIRDYRPDVIQTWIPQMDVLGGLASMFTGVSFVLSERSCSLAYGGGWKEDLRRLVARRAAAIVANSENGRKYWQSTNHSRAVRLIRNGFPFQKSAGRSGPRKRQEFRSRQSWFCSPGGTVTRKIP
jgi:hypothetical protein